MIINLPYGNINSLLDDLKIKKKNFKKTVRIDNLKGNIMY